eukprot:GHVL01021127.1.p1 GENE.GHVL01021127.1~~GHVL01021127.1.p1  ORF type:complete len:595 (-),score=167.55 GHVL01021127.1:39-1823(-)
MIKVVDEYLSNSEPTQAAIQVVCGRCVDGNIDIDMKKMPFITTGDILRINKANLSIKGYYFDYHWVPGITVGYMWPLGDGHIKPTKEEGVVIGTCDETVFWTVKDRERIQKLRIVALDMLSKKIFTSKYLTSLSNAIQNSGYVDVILKVVKIKKSPFILEVDDGSTTDPVILSGFTVLEIKWLTDSLNPIKESDWLRFRNISLKKSDNIFKIEMLSRSRLHRIPHFCAEAVERNNEIQKRAASVSKAHKRKIKKTDYLININESNASFQSIPSLMLLKRTAEEGVGYIIRNFRIVGYDKLISKPQNFITEKCKICKSRFSGDDLIKNINNLSINDSNAKLPCCHPSKGLRLKFRMRVDDESCVENAKKMNLNIGYISHAILVDELLTDFIEKDILLDLNITDNLLSILLNIDIIGEILKNLLHNYGPCDLLYSENEPHKRQFDCDMYLIAIKIQSKIVFKITKSKIIKYSNKKMKLTKTVNQQPPHASLTETVNITSPKLTETVNAPPKGGLIGGPSDPIIIDVNSSQNSSTPPKIIATVKRPIGGGDERPPGVPSPRIIISPSFDSVETGIDDLLMAIETMDSQYIVDQSNDE